MSYRDEFIQAKIVSPKYTLDQIPEGHFPLGNILSFCDQPIEVRIETSSSIKKLVLTRNHWFPFWADNLKKISMANSEESNQLIVFLFSESTLKTSGERFGYNADSLITIYKALQRYPITTWMYELWNRLYFEVFLCQNPLRHVIDFCASELLKEKFYLTVGLKQKLNHPSDASKDMDKQTAAAVKYISENLNEDVSLAEVAREARVSLSTLRRKFLKHFGITPIHYLRKQRMAKAYELLSTTNYSVGDVAFMVGYMDHSAFTMAFKNEYRINPSNIASNHKR